MRRRDFLPLALLATPALLRAQVVEYEVREVSRIGSRLIAQGRREYEINNIEVYPYERNGQRISEKFLELSSGFKIGARIFSEKQLSGFGLLARKDDTDFSWEWFNKESASRFTKLQGGQAVEVRTYATPFGEELTQVRFLEDTTLRFKHRGAADDTHHIVVKAGSVLRFR